MQKIKVGFVVLVGLMCAAQANAQGNSDTFCREYGRKYSATIGNFWRGYEISGRPIKPVPGVALSTSDARSFYDAEDAGTAISQEAEGARLMMEGAQQGGMATGLEYDKPTNVFYQLTLSLAWGKAATTIWRVDKSLVVYKCTYALDLRW